MSSSFISKILVPGHQHVQEIQGVEVHCLVISTLYSGR